MRNIHQNLFWAFAYNVALILVAAGILYHSSPTVPSWCRRFCGLSSAVTVCSPPILVAAMALSSVTVLTNALRLRRVWVG